MFGMAKISQDAAVNECLRLFFYPDLLDLYYCKKKDYFDASSSHDLFNIQYLIIPPAKYTVSFSNWKSRIPIISMGPF